MSSKKNSLPIKEKDALSIIKELYSVTDYMGKYGTDLWITVILCGSLGYLMYYQYLVNALEVIRADWPNYKCNPAIMPFAGFIVKPVDKSYFAFTTDNFSTCVFDILKSISQMAVNPFQMVLKMINELVQDLTDGFNALRGLFDNLRSGFENIFEKILAAISNLVVQFMYIIIKMKDTMAKGFAVLVNALFILFGSFMAMTSLFLAVIDLITLILIIMVCVVALWIYITIGLWPITPIPIVGQPVIPAAMGWTYTSITGICILIAIMIPVVIFMVFMMRVLKLSSPPPPKLPGCFAGDTVIPLFKDGTKKIQDIVIGDQLKNGGVVTATIQFAAADQNIYKLNGVFVTGEHRVFHPLLKWIKVKDHPASVYIPTFHEPYVYCLNTTDKVFLINDTLFSDWDDVDNNVIHSLQQNCVANGFLPDGFIYEDIHTYLDSGFHSTTKVKLQNGLYVPICEIKVNDVLEEGTNGMGTNGMGTNAMGTNAMGTNAMGTNAMGTKVLGVIKIAGDNIKQYKHKFGNDSFICGSKNIHVADVNLGIINCMQSESVDVQSESVLYHLLTDTKFFIANNIKVNDYNYGIDAYLKL